MDFLKNLTENKQHESGSEQKQESGGIGGLLNNALGGGQKGEHKEDGLDKAFDYVQEHVLKKGSQENESAIEQAKDEQITDAIRSGYKKATGKEFFVADKS